MSYLAYINIVLLAGSKRVTAKMGRIKLKKYSSPCRLSTTINAAKQGTKWIQIELAMQAPTQPSVNRTGEI